MPKGIFVRTDEYRAKVSRKMKGRKITWADKIGVANKGQVPWNKGKKLGVGYYHSNGKSRKEVSRDTRRKMSEAKKGMKHHNWKGGTTPIMMGIRQCLEYKLWRSNVLQRDNWTCQTCGNRGIKLEVHHLKSFSSITERYDIKSVTDALECGELWDIGNGVALCKPCHLLTNNGRPKSSKDIIEF